MYSPSVCSLHLQSFAASFSLLKKKKNRVWNAGFLHCIAVADMKCPVTPSDQLLALIHQVRGHFTVTHKLLEAQEVQAASPQTLEVKV